VTLTCAVLASAAARADCPVSLSGFDETMAKRVRSELDVELSRTKPCQGADTLSVSLTWQDGTVSVSVNGQRNGTERAFRRQVNPAELPPDGLALTLAAVSAELITELDRAPVTVAQSEPPPPPPPPPSWHVTARAGGEGWSRGQVQLGGELAVRWSPGRLALELSAGGRDGITRSFDAGVVRSASALAGLSVLPVIVRSGPLALSAEGGLTGGGLWFSPSAHDGFAAQPRASWLLSARAGLDLAAAFFSIRVGLDVPLHGASAVSGGQELVAVGGVGGYLTIGGGLAF
jgi:hypothetical protein